MPANIFIQASGKPSGTFIDLSANNTWSGGLGTDDTLKCWGDKVRTVASVAALGGGIGSSLFYVKKDPTGACEGDSSITTILSRRTPSWADRS